MIPVKEIFLIALSRTKFVLAILCLLSGVYRLHSQDIHFTQFFTTPLVLNPAQTGNYNGNYRIGFNFKAQWPWAIGTQVYNYHTESPYIDFSFGENKIKVGWMGIGFNFLNDEAGDGRLTYRRICGSYAYHQAFDKDHRYVLSLGVGVSYMIRTVDFSKFYFNNQWVDDRGFDMYLDPNEPWQSQNFSMVDINAGINFGGQVHEQVKVTAGFSMMHINQPKHSFYNGTERLGFRYQATAGAIYKINNTWAVTLDAYYTYEKKASDLNIGSMASYSFYNRHRTDPEHVFYAGAYYRMKDALSPLIGYQFRRTRLLFSYDVTLSKLVNPAKANGGPEISLVHVGSWGKNLYNSKKVYCPAF